MADHCKTGDTDGVERAAALRFFRSGKMRIGFGHKYGVDPVIDAACASQPQYIPVIDQRRLRDWQNKDARFPSAFDDAERVDMRCMLDTGSKAPRSAQPIAAINRKGRAGTRALARDYRKAAVSKQLLNSRFSQVCRA